MTEQELIDYGYKPEECKIGTLYFKAGFFVRLKDGVALLYRIRDDEKLCAEITTIDELRDKEFRLLIEDLNINRLSAVLAYQHIVKNYPEYEDDLDRIFHTELEAFRKANNTWYETNFDPAVDREAIFLDELTNKMKSITTAFG